MADNAIRGRFHTSAARPTNHAWINRGTQPCRILFVLMDSKQP